MTIISSVQEPSDFDFPLEGEDSLDLELKAYPPVDDFIAWAQKINWSDLSVRLQKGTAALLMFAMKFSEKSYDFHEYLYDKISYTNVGPKPYAK
jgi:hypothetical protein